MFKHLLRRYIPIGIILTGTGLTIIAATFVERWEADNAQIQLQKQIENLATALQRSLNWHIDVLIPISDYYTVARRVERHEFAKFVQRSLHSYPGIQALEWTPLVKSQRLAYEQQMRAQGFKIQITELSPEAVLTRAGDRSQYIPVTYVEPFVGNAAALGYDLNSNPTRAAAIQVAKDTGQITATGRIRLVQKQRDQFGFLVFLPLYQGTTTPAPKARRTHLQGFLLGVFRVSDVVEESLQALSDDINFTLYDENASSQQRFLGCYDATRNSVITVELDQESPQVATDPAL